MIMMREPAALNGTGFSGNVISPGSDCRRAQGLQPGSGILVAAVHPDRSSGLSDDKRDAPLSGCDGVAQQPAGNVVASVRQRLMNLSRERGEDVQFFVEDRCVFNQPTKSTSS